MADNHRVRIEEIDWKIIFPFVRIFESLGNALHPPKLLMAVGLMIAVYLVGATMDAMWPIDSRVRANPRNVAGKAPLDALVPPAAGDRPRSIRITAGFENEFDAFRAGQLKEFREAHQDSAGQYLAAITPGLSYDEKKEMTESPSYAWARKQALQHYHQKIKDADGDEERIKELRKEQQELVDLIDKDREERFDGVFETLLRIKLTQFRAIKSRLIEGDLVGLSNQILSSLGTVLIDMPRWLFTAHPVFGIVLTLIELALLSLIGGALARMVALHATRDERIGTREAFDFAMGKSVWYFLTPLLPVIIVLLVGVMLALGGLALFNDPYTAVLGSFLYILALVGGIIMAVFLVGLLASLGLHYPAIAVEGTDAFDAIQRSLNYVLLRPWRWAFYSIIALLYSAIVLTLFAVFVTLVIWATETFAGAWVMRTVGDEENAINLFEALRTQDWERLNMAGDVAAAMMWVWVSAVKMLVPAAFLLMYFATNTWIYLLLRRSADGTEYDDIYLPPAVDRAEAAVAATTPDKVEPSGDSAEPSGGEAKPGG